MWELMLSAWQAELVNYPILLMQSAAQNWRIPWQSASTTGFGVVRAPDGREASYGEIATPTSDLSEGLHHRIRHPVRDD